MYFLDYINTQSYSYLFLGSEAKGRESYAKKDTKYNSLSVMNESRMAGNMWLPITGEGTEKNIVLQYWLLKEGAVLHDYPNELNLF